MFVAWPEDLAISAFALAFCSALYGVQQILDEILKGDLYFMLLF